jgi:hypothetical protein
VTTYRAKITLEKLEQYTDRYDSLNVRHTELSSHTVTGATPADAMVQLCAHADSLYDWHMSQDEAASDQCVCSSTPLDYNGTTVHQLNWDADCPEHGERAPDAEEEDQDEREPNLLGPTIGSVDTEALRRGTAQFAGALKAAAESVFRRDPVAGRKLAEADQLRDENTQMRGQIITLLGLCDGLQRFPDYDPAEASVTVQEIRKIFSGGDEQPETWRVTARVDELLPTAEGEQAAPAAQAEEATR